MANKIHSKSQLVLIVEDSDADFEATRRAFKKSDLKNPIHRCQEGDEAMDFIFQRGIYQDAARPGIILLDLNLPGTDGKEILHDIKQNDSLKTIPVVVLSTSNHSEDVEDCYSRGANSYIQKPVDMEGLFVAISRLKNYWFETVILP